VEPAPPFLLGVNYWPRRSAMHLWAAFDPGAVREEFATIRSIGLTHVRVFLLWESFQPRPDVVDPGALARLVRLCDLAADAGLAVQATFFTGHMSGPNWVPDWLLDRSRQRAPGDRQLVGIGRVGGADAAIHDPYESPEVLAAEDLQIDGVTRALAGHPALWGWSLGNEPDLLARPSSAAVGRGWARARAAAIRRVDPVHPVLIGLHSGSLEDDPGFHVDDIARETDISVMHGYPFYSAVSRSALDLDYVPFLAALTAALAGRPVLFEEMGVNTQWPDGPSHWGHQPMWDGGTRRVYFASEEDAAAYVDGVLHRLHRVGSLGAFLWCFADYAPELWDRPPCDFQAHERFFGLVRPDGSLKPSAEVVRRFAARSPRVVLPERRVELGVSSEAYYADPVGHARRLYQAFRTLGG
jgi:endo-1,4-beta-mannosidase